MNARHITRLALSFAVAVMLTGAACGQYAVPQVMCEITFPENRNPSDFECFGDLNQDGFDDLAFWNWQGDRIQLLFGGRQMDGNVDYTIHSDSSTGANILLAGLVGHIIPDAPLCIAVWAHNFQDTGSFINVYSGIQEEPVFSLREDRPDWKLRMLPGGQHGMQPSDFNGDGFDDLFVLHYTETGYREGYFEIYNGGHSLDTIPDWQLPRSHLNAYSLACGSDLNDDGYDDLILYGQHLREGSGGYANLIFLGGNPMDTIPDLFYDPQNFEDGPYQGRYGGHAPGMMIGDINCDGYCDWVDTWGGGWCDTTGEGGSYWEGGVFIFFGSEELDSIPDLDSTLGLHEDDKELQAGDFNGDGKDDVVSYGHSSNGLLNVKFGTRWLQNTVDMGINIRRDYRDRYYFGEGLVVGDFNGDGADDFAMANGHTRPPERLVIFAGNLDWEVSVSDPSPLAPYTLHLAPPFPNPFNSTTRIGFGLDKSLRTNVMVFDPLGRKIADLIPPRMMSDGRHEVIWNASGVPAGEYLIRLQAGEKSQVTSVQVVK